MSLIARIRFRLRMRRHHQMAIVTPEPRSTAPRWLARAPHVSASGALVYCNPRIGK